MYADPLAERLWCLRVVELLALVHRKPLSNTPGIASVGEKKKKRNCCDLEMAQAGVVCIIRKHTHALLNV